MIDKSFPGSSVFMCANYAAGQAYNMAPCLCFRVKPSRAAQRVCTAYLWTQLKEDKHRVLRMGRAFPFKQGGLSLFAVPAPMATQ